METMAFAFGPVPSRRLGYSLGINHIPPKTCTYACIYCQLGATSQMQVEREAFYDPEAVVAAVRSKVSAAAASGTPVDYLTFVPDGEPTLDLNLGPMLAALKPLGIPLAVITNASLMGDPEVQEALLLADWVSLKVDAVDVPTWKRIDRPHGKLRLMDILAGEQAFARDFQGRLVTETMLVAGVNDADSTLSATASVIAGLHPAVAYLAVPTRPPAEPWVHPPEEAVLNRAYQLFAEIIPNVEYLIGYEGTAFAASGDAARDLLSITAVHPMREDAVAVLLSRCDAGWEVVEQLIDEGALTKAAYGSATFYMRKLHG